jgi:HD superfamily phosphohydrolase
VPPIPFRYQCDRCFDTGLWLTETGHIGECPKRAFSKDHPDPNAASEMLRHVVTRCYAAASANKTVFRPDPMAFDLARSLTHFTSQSPCPTEKLLDYFFCDKHLNRSQQLRIFAYTIEELRNVWALPVGSRKAKPSGYWIITSLEDCKAWLREATSAPKTQLVTIWRAAKAAFPILAGQHEFAFMDALDVEAADVD